jgi:hypothetical protein
VSKQAHREELVHLLTQRGSVLTWLLFRLKRRSRAPTTRISEGMKTRSVLACATAALALLAGLPVAKSAGLETTFVKPTPSQPSVYRWQGAVLQAPGTASGVAAPTSPAACADAAPGLCEDITLNVPDGVKPSTLYVRISWRHPVWKAYLYVTSPDGKSVYPNTAPDASPATECDLSLFDKGCGNESSIPIDEVTIPNPAPGAWKVRVAAVNIHDESYSGLASLTNARPLQYIKEKLAQLTSHLTKSQRVNVVFAGWKPTEAELNEIKANVPDEYVPAIAQKVSADFDDVRDDPSGNVSGLIQHITAHYTGTDPTNSHVLPNQLFPNYVPYFEPLKFNFDYHFLAADDLYTKDLFLAAKNATELDHDPGPTGIYATSLSLPVNYKVAYLTDYNAKFGQFRGTDHLVSDTTKWDLVDAFTVEDWIHNSRMNSRYARSFTDLSTGQKTSAAFINPDPAATRDAHWNGNGKRAVNIDQNPQGVERGVTFILMDTFSSAYADQYFRPDHYHYWGTFDHITDPDTGGGGEIDDARGWGGRYRFYFQDLGSAPSFYERENWLREEVVGQDGSAGFDPPIWQWRNDPTWNGTLPVPADPTGATRAGGSTLGEVLGWDMNQGIAFKYIGSYLYRPIPADVYILATNNWIDHYSQPDAGGFYKIDFNKLYKSNEAVKALRSAIPYATFMDSVPSLPHLADPQELGCADNHHQVVWAGTPGNSPGLKSPSVDTGCAKVDDRQEAIEEGKNNGALATGAPDMGVDVDTLRNFIDHNRARFAPLIDGALTVPVLNIYFEKLYNVAIPLIVGGIAESTNDGDGWGQVDNLNERSVWKGAIDCAKSSPAAPACAPVSPFSNARALTYIVQHESAHGLGLHHPHDGTVSVGKAEGPPPPGSPFTGKWHYYYTMNKWQYDYTASPTTYGHTYGTYESVDQDRLMYGHTAEYLKQAQDWLADAFFLEGAAGNASPSTGLATTQKTVVADRDLSSELFRVGDYLHAQYAMRNAANHAKGFMFQPVAPHLMQFAQAKAAAAQPTDARVTDGKQIFAIHPQTYFDEKGHASAVKAPAQVLGSRTTRHLPKPTQQGSHLPATGLGDTAGFGITALVLALASRRWMRRAA